MNCPQCGNPLVEDDPNKFVGEILDDDKISILMFCETCGIHWDAVFKFIGLAESEV